MKAFCGIAFEKNKVFLSCASLKKGNLQFLEEKELALPDEKNFIEKLRVNSEKIEQSIVELEKRHSLSFNDIFMELPAGLAKEIEAREKIVFPKKKRLTPAVINTAKKYLEDKFLEWDQHCLHNIVLDYKAEGIKYSQAPLGVFTKKIELNSLLIYIKDSFYKEILDIFFNMEKNFVGFIAHKISMFSQGFSAIRENQIVISVNDLNSYAGIKDKEGKIYQKEFHFGIKTIIGQLAKQYTISTAASAQLLDRYGSFKNIPYVKEITIKKEDSYLNLSTQALANFLKTIFSGNLKRIIDEALQMIPEPERGRAVFSFLGPLTIKDGFYSYIKKMLPYKVEIPFYKCRSSAFGCIKYGFFRPLEDEYQKKGSLLERVRKVYQEYF
jgi:cell division ATPase FtsA